MGVIHIDDVQPLTLDQGELRWTERHRLGGPAGLQHAGLSRFVLPPGGRSTPPHVHSDEEEICLILEGAGLSWQDGTTHAVTAGDVLVHRCGAEAHTLVAGEAGLTALFFGEGSRTHLTYMPRTKIMWAATRWLPADGPHPFAADVALGPLDVPAPEGPAPQVAPLTTRLDRVTLADGEATGAVAHAAEEEVVYVVAGDGTVTFGEGPAVALRPGNVVGLPAGTGVTSRFTGPLELLRFGTVVAGNVTWFADEGVARVRGLPMALRPA